MNKLDQLPSRQLLIKWLVDRQYIGFNGRPNKHMDTCYSFWVIGTLQTLGCSHLIDTEAVTKFIYQCQNEKIGGIAKVRIHLDKPDPMHTYNAIGGLALCGHEGVAPLCAAYGMSFRALGIKPPK